MNVSKNIKKFNDILIRFLNDLVNSIGEDTELRNNFFIDIINRLKENLESYNFQYSEEIIKIILSQAFSQYANTLKIYFDHSNISKIPIEHPVDETLVNKMNQIISNLTNAVNNINTITQYNELKIKMRNSFVHHFKQNCPNYETIEYNIDQILNDVIFSTMYKFTEQKKSDYLNYTLPDLYKICDEITKNINDQQIVEKVDSNEEIIKERDKYINDILEIEIHEGMDNGVVTLLEIDQLGNQRIYRGREAMDKLTSYNQLFESSRPGKKVDTSHWPIIVEDENNNTLSNPTDTITNPNNETINDNLNNNQINNNEEVIKSYLNKYNNDSLIDDSLLTKENTESKPTNTNSNEQVKIFNLTNGFNNLTESISNSNNNNNLNDNNSNNNSDSSNSNSNNILNAFNPLTDKMNIINEDLNSNDEDFNNIRKKMGMGYVTDTNNIDYSSQFSFIPTFNNPNSDRDQFIKASTGFTIEEDLDNNGELYFKVIDTSGREVIYTGFEAVRMIKNYNKAYLDANPHATVDTSLIDKFENK